MESGVCVCVCVCDCIIRGSGGLEGLRPYKQEAVATPDECVWRGGRKKKKTPRTPFIIPAFPEAHFRGARDREREREKERKRKKERKKEREREREKERKKERD